MPITVNTNFINQSDQYLLDAKNVKGTYVVVGDYSELGSLPTATTVNGSLVYCQSAYSTYSAGFYQYDGSTWNKIDYVTTDKYHTSGSWNGLTYTATNQGNAGDLTLTIPTGNSATTVCVGNDSRLSDSRTPTAHASTATTYGVGTTSNYGHVKTQSGDMNGTSSSDGIAAGLGHTHSNYGTYTKPSGGIPDSDLASDFVKTVNSASPDNSGDVTIDSGDILVDTSTTTTYGGSSITSAIDGLSGRIDNAGTVTSVQVQAGTGLVSSQDTAQTSTLNTTIGIDSDYKLQTNDEYKDSSLYWITPTGYAGIASALSSRWVVDNAAGFTEPYNGMKVMLRIPVAGVGTTGAMMSIDGGSDWNTYHPIAYNLNSVFTTHYPVNTNKIFVYNSTQTMTGYWMSPLTSQPSDWATKYTSYYQTNGDVNDPKATWTAVTGSSAPTFVTGKYGKATSKSYTGVWQGESNYDSNTTMTYGTLAYYFRPYVAEALYRYKFVMLDKDNRLVPLTTTNNTETAYADYASGTSYAKDIVVHRASGGVGRWYKSLQASNKGHAPESNPTWWQEVNNKTATTLSFRPDKIYWYQTTTNISAGAVVGGNTLMDIGYNQPYMTYCNFNKGILAYRMVYLCGTYNKTTGLFTLNDGGVAGSDGYYTQVPTNTANITLSDYFISGKDYILLGGSYSSNNYLHLRDDHPMYHFDGTNLIPYDTYNENRIEASIGSDTWRNINVNGTELLGNAISTGAINFKNGDNVTITGSGNDVTIAATDTNQTIKGNGTAFGSNDVIDIKGSGIVTVSGNATNKEITISASHQGIKSLDTTATTAQSIVDSEAIAGSGAITLHKVSKTGTYSDLIGTPTVDSTPTDGSSNLVTSDGVYDADTIIKNRIGHYLIYATTSQNTAFTNAMSNVVYINNDTPIVLAKGESIASNQFVPGEVLQVRFIIGGQHLKDEEWYQDGSFMGTQTVWRKIPQIGTLNTTAATAQTTSSNEALSGSVTLHKVAKTGTFSDLIGAPTISTTPTTGTGLWDANTIIDYIASRGQQLVTNGTFLLGNNYNFATYGIFDGADANGGGGCVYRSGAGTQFANDEFISVVKGKTYKLTYDLKPNIGFDNNVNATSGINGFLPYLDQYDLDKNKIEDKHTNYVAGSLVQLTQDLVAGATKMYVTDASSWQTSNGITKILQIWDYLNSKGYQYAPGEYTRHVFDMGAGTTPDTTNNAINFVNAYSGDTIPAGTYVSQNRGGGYAYIGSYDKPAAYVWNSCTHTTTSSTIRGGCAFAKLGWLWNYNVSNSIATEYNGSSNVPVGRIIHYTNAAPTGPATGYYFCKKAVGVAEFITVDNTEYYDGPFNSVISAVKTKITNIQFTVTAL